jgi:hypothetical protein
MSEYVGSVENSHLSARRVRSAGTRGVASDFGAVEQGLASDKGTSLEKVVTFS